MIRTTRLIGIREVAEARQKREMEEALRRVQQEHLPVTPETEMEIEKWWDAPTLLEAPCLVCEVLLDSALEKLEETTLILDDENPDRQTILNLIRTGIDNHVNRCGVMPGQIRLQPITILLCGLQPYYVASNEIIPLVEDMSLQINSVKCISHRKFII